VDGCQSLVTRRDSAMALGFQLQQKGAHSLRCQGFDRQAFDPGAGLSRHERQQQTQCVSVALLGVARQISLAHEMFEQKLANPRSKFGGVSFIRVFSPCIVQNAGWLH
jgi:hypothetical protein